MKDPQVKDQWYTFIKTTRSDYNEKTAKGAIVCDGHFNDQCFNPGHVSQFQLKCRTFAPGLLQTAVPVYKVATAPHFPSPQPEQYLTVGDVHQVTPTTRTTVGLTVDSPKKRCKGLLKGILLTWVSFPWLLVLPDTTVPGCSVFSIQI